MKLTPEDDANIYDLVMEREKIYEKEIKPVENIALAKKFEVSRMSISRAVQRERERRERMHS